MGSRHLTLCCALLALAGGSACAVNRPASPVRCTVEGAELLPAASGGAEALCAEIEAATADSAATASVSVRVVKSGSLAATVTVGGRVLPEIKMTRLDSDLDRSAFRRFAQAIAAASRAAPKP